MDAFITVIKLAIFAIIIVICSLVSYDRGYSDSKENMARIKCEIEYSGKTINEIPVNCLRFFEKEVKIYGHNSN